MSYRHLFLSATFTYSMLSISSLIYSIERSSVFGIIVYSLLIATGFLVLFIEITNPGASVGKHTDNEER